MEVAEKYGVTRWYISHWCKENNIERVLGKNGIMEYVLSKADLKKFENRNTKKTGRPKKTTEK